jgi:cell division protein FtsB
MSLKKIVFFCIILASLFIVNNLVQSIYSLWQKKNLVENSIFEVEREKRRNQELKNKLSQVRDRQFVEEEARNKLFMLKQGEQAVILSEKVLQEATVSAKKPASDTRPNWKKWWDFFF